MQIRTDETVTEVARQLPHALDVFDRFHVDYCCGGNRTLERACARAGAALDAVVAALLAERNETVAKAAVDAHAASLTALIDHILDTHHAFTREALARLDPLLEKVEAAHSGRHPGIAKVRSLFLALERDLQPHLVKEEMVLFPYVRESETARLRNERGPDPPCGSVVHPIDAMISEHEQAGSILAEMRSAACEYAVPEDACASYRRAYEALVGLELDLHRHIHLENNVLFPRVLKDIGR